MPTQRAEHRPHAFLNLVVTPESIPKFIIPRLGSSTRSQGPHCPPAQGAGAPCAEDQEPGTRLAMSLPHLRRVTTPYGFLALGESPCVYRKESLFFGGSDDSWGAVRFGLSKVRTGGQPGPRGLTPPRPVHFMRGRSCTSLPSPPPSPPSCPGKTSRSFSWDLSVPSRHLRLGVPDGKTRLQRLIRKHLSRAQKKRRARGCSSSGGVEEESGSTGE